MGHIILYSDRVLECGEVFQNLREWLAAWAPRQALRTLLVNQLLRLLQHHPLHPTASLHG